ncbi:MAG: thiamine phosphate synthase [Candidatus Binatia bacterium]
MRQPNFALYLITERTATQGRNMLWALEQALDGGVKAIQLREKDLDGKSLFDLATKVSALCRRYNAELFINDRIDIALAVEAAGVQLGKASLPIAAARALLGTARAIGYSAHSLEEARDAERDGADFVLFGPVYFTPSKAPYGSPQGLTALKNIVEKVALPVYAIGGVNAANLAQAMNTGIYGVALISAIMGAENPASATKTILTLIAR